MTGDVLPIDSRLEYPRHAKSNIEFDADYIVTILIHIANKIHPLEDNIYNLAITN